MAVTLPEKYQLTPEQRRRLGAVYQLILSWRREGKDHPISQNERSAQTSAPLHEPQSLATEQNPEA